MYPKFWETESFSLSVWELIFGRQIVATVDSAGQYKTSHKNKGEECMLFGTTTVMVSV